ncbi:hypothetical protein SAMN02745824_3089 [Parasphingorhabdus marina DSM 22363]|uniref:Uncharacterized protein n=1 Tax=Parasphingorhabdus marina DSM 22363 TaxID=1123272 RepID=A0A1N6H173_9SPHN|nr:hypothetical protein SAMN02745824_3089 [Parasphingorhabdus marina DSM 22363]
MPHFIVNKNAQSNGDHEVHNKTAGCNNMPLASNQKDLGYHTSCYGAVAEAKKTYPQSNGCYYCANACHTG